MLPDYLPLCFPAWLDSAGQVGHQGSCMSHMFSLAVLKEIGTRNEIRRLPEQPSSPQSPPTTTPARMGPLDTSHLPRPGQQF